MRDILKASSQINQFVSGLDADMFKAVSLRVNAVLYNLIIIGEAIKNIPDEVTNQHPTVRWRDIGRFGDRVVHHYFKTDLDIAWEIVQVHLPELHTLAEKMLQDIESSSTDKTTE